MTLCTIKTIRSKALSSTAYSKKQIKILNPKHTKFNFNQNYNHPSRYVHIRNADYESALLVTYIPLKLILVRWASGWRVGGEWAADDVVSGSSSSPRHGPVIKQIRRRSKLKFAEIWGTRARYPAAFCPTSADGGYSDGVGLKEALIKNKLKTGLNGRAKGDTCSRWWCSSEMYSEK